MRYFCFVSAISETFRKHARIQAKAILFVLSTLFALSAQARLINPVIIEPSDILFQNFPEYIYRNGQLVESTKPFSFTYIDRRGAKRSVKGYLRPGTELLLKTLVEKKAANPNFNFHFLSSWPQAKLFGFLTALNSDQLPIIDTIGSAFGSEVIQAYNSLKGNQNGNLKDIGLFHPSRTHYQSLWTSIKGIASKGLSLNKDDLMKRMGKGPDQGINTAIMIDSHAKNVVKHQRDNVVVPAPSPWRNEKFKAKFANAVKRPLTTLGNTLLNHEVIVDNTNRYRQLRILVDLLSDAEKTSVPTDVRRWSELLRYAKTLSLDISHYSFLIADVFKEDSEDTEVLILGRDTDLFYEGVKTLIEPLGIKSHVSYINMSRLIASKPASDIIKALEYVGVDIEGVRAGRKKLRVIDSNHTGSIARNIIRAVAGEQGESPQWRDIASRMSAFYFNVVRTNRIPLESWPDFNTYMVNGGFFEDPVHQERAGGYALMRGTTAYLDTYRPKPIQRTAEIREDGSLIELPAHPSELRARHVLAEHIKAHFSSPDIRSVLKNRLQFVRNQPGHYPASWPANEPYFGEAPLSRIIDPANLAEAMNPKKADNKLGMSFSKHIRSQRRHNMLPFTFTHLHPDSLTRWHMYRPEWAANETEIDLGQNFFKPNFDSSSSNSINLEPLNTASLHERRIAAVQALSRSARGEHLGGKTRVYGEELAETTRRSNNQVTDNLLLAKDLKFDDYNQLGEFIKHQIIDIYVKEVRRGYESGDIWRVHNYQNDQQLVSGEFSDAQQAIDLEQDWIWFSEWPFMYLKHDYDPIRLGAKVHFYFANYLHPSIDGAGKSARDLVDFVFLRKGYMPPDWSRVTKDEYWQKTQSYDDLLELITALSVSGDTYQCKSIFQ